MWEKKISQVRIDVVVYLSSWVDLPGWSSILYLEKEEIIRVLVGNVSAIATGHRPSLLNNIITRQS